MQKIYQLKNKIMPWGDYGDMLLSGMTGHESRDKNGMLQLERTGPFVPPIFISGISDVILSDTLKQQLQVSSLKLGDITFKPVTKKKIVKLDWHTWDLTAQEPKVYPEEGEPENYILRRPHNLNISNQLGELWELCAAVSGEIIREPVDERFWHSNIYLSIPAVSFDVFKANKTSRVFVTEEGKNYIEKYSDGWLTGEICPINERGLYIVHEWDERAFQDMKAKSHPLNRIPYVQNDIPAPEKDE